MVHFGLVYKADPRGCQRTFLPRLRPYLMRVTLILVLHSAHSCRPSCCQLEHIQHNFDNVEDCHKYSRGGQMLAPVTKP